MYKMNDYKIWSGNTCTQISVIKVTILISQNHAWEIRDRH